jgi:hypothetical protein
MSMVSRRPFPVRVAFDDACKLYYLMYASGRCLPASLFSVRVLHPEAPWLTALARSGAGRSVRVYRAEGGAA